MFLKYLFLTVCGLSAGGVIAAGLFAFITTIGVIPRQGKPIRPMRPDFMKTVSCWGRAWETERSYLGGNFLAEILLWRFSASAQAYSWAA